MPPGYDPPSDRFTSTPGDSLCELAGRICYDSVDRNRPGRPTAAYFENVLSRKHFSVIAHPVETFEVRHLTPSSSDDPGLRLWSASDALHCRPGLWVTRIAHDAVRFCLNLRAVTEWAQHGAEIPTLSGDPADDTGAMVYKFVYNALLPKYPLALSHAAPPAPGTPDFTDSGYRMSVMPPELPKEKWCSLYISGISRDCSLELIRHHWQTNPSQESTRYVDKYPDEPVLSPVVRAAGDEYLIKRIRTGQSVARKNYATVFRRLTESGVDKKTARGAARSCLTGSTTTKLVFSLSLFQARHLVALRSGEGAEREIRELSAAMREELVKVWPDL